MHHKLGPEKLKTKTFEAKYYQQSSTKPQNMSEFNPCLLGPRGDH